LFSFDRSIDRIVFSSSVLLLRMMYVVC